MTRNISSKAPSSKPSQTDEAELLVCKNQLLSIQKSKVGIIIEQTAQALRELLKEIARVNTSLKSDVPDYKIASLILLAEAYFEMALLARQASNIKGEAKAYLEAQECLTRAQIQETCALKNGRVINGATIAALNSRSFAGPKAAEKDFQDILLATLLLETEDQPTHHTGPD